MLGFYGIDVFSRQQFIATDKRSKIQNEAMYVLSHVSKNLLGAIGDVVDPPLTITPSAGNTATLRATIDSFADGVKNSTNDSNISYCFGSTNCNNAAAAASTVYFNSNISAVAPATVPAAEVLARHVRTFNVTQSGNFLTVRITTCWDPAETSQACGTLDNPALNMTNIIKMPSVSAQ